MAVAAERAGDGPVVLTDTDPQGTTADWFNAREAQTPGYVPATMATLDQKIKALAEAGAAWLFVDTAPAINEQNADLLRLADLVIVPLCASPNDVRALAKTLPILQAAGKPFVFVLTRVNPQARLTVQTVMTLSEHGAVNSSHLFLRPVNSSPAEAHANGCARPQPAQLHARVA